jgi:hypothetical protein
MNIMKNGALFLLIILILGLILAPFLGGRFKEGYTNQAMQYADKVNMESGVTNAGSNGYDNYDHYSKSSAPTVFYGPNGSKANVMKDASEFYIIITGANGETSSYSTKIPATSKTTTSDAKSNASTEPKKTAGSSESISSLMKQFNNTTFYGPNGGSARFFSGNDGQYAIEATKANGDTTIYTATNTYTYNYGSQSSSYSASPFENPFTSSKPSSTPASSNSANSSGKYDSSLPQGIPKNMIPRGQEDLYILKSEIVPPVCPACPTASVCPTTGKKEKCPPCPACARCPEPSFECKKVPNYNSSGNSNGYGRAGSYDATGQFNSSTGSPGYLPVPVLSDFSTFGM